MGMSLGSSKREKQPEPDINITPLVDVVLVLLIIFMVVAPALNNDLVRLPEIEQADPKPKDDNAVEITLSGDGSTVLEQKKVDKETLKRELKQIHSTTADRQLLLKTDVNVPYERVRTTLGMLQEIGFKGVSLKVEEKKKDG